MMSRRNVISVCIVIAVIMVLVIILASTGIKKEKNILFSLGVCIICEFYNRKRR